MLLAVGVAASGRTRKRKKGERETAKDPESQDVQDGGGGEQETVSGMRLFLGASPHLRVLETPLEPPPHRSASTAAKRNSTW